MESESRARIFQSTMEWWKTVFDFYKHLTTIALASIAAFGALLGGVFPDAVGPNAGWKLRSLVIVAFVAFALTAIMAVQGMHYARRSILHMRDYEGAKIVDDRAYVQALEELREWRWWKGLLSRKRVWFLVWLFFTTGIVAFILFLYIAVGGHGVEQQTKL